MDYVLNKLFRLPFVDDTIIFDTTNDLNDFIDNVNAEIKMVINWLNAKRCYLNIDKTHFTLFRNKCKTYDQF